MQPKIKSRDEFSRNVEHLVFSQRMSFMDAVVHQATMDELDVESAAKLITPAIKEKIRLEANRLRMLKETKTEKLV